VKKIEAEIFPGAADAVASQKSGGGGNSVMTFHCSDNNTMPSGACNTTGFLCVNCSILPAGASRSGLPDTNHDFAA
jgi:hypothetical protein